MDLSVLIVSWNTRRLLLDCLESLFREMAGTAGYAIEVLVVENGSQDGTAEAVGSQYPQVRLLANRENRGFGAANNQALADCRGELILFLNPDTVLLPGSLAALIEFMGATLEAGAAGARLLNADGSLQQSCYPRPTLGREFWRLFHLDRLRPLGAYAMQRWPVDRPRAVDNVMGACLLVRRAVLDQVGAFDERFFLYSEEIDLCLRIRRAGWGIYWVPAAQVLHHGGASSQQVPGGAFLHLYQGKVRYFRKHHGRLSAWIYKLILAAASLARLAISPAAMLERSPRRDRHRLLAANYGRMLRLLPGW